MDKISYFILIPMVYLAFAVLVVGVAVELALLFKTKKEAVVPIFPLSRARFLRAMYDTFLMPQVRRHATVLWIFLIAFHVKEEVNVYPMVAPGAAVGEMIRRPKPQIVQGYSGVEPSW